MFFGLHAWLAIAIVGVAYGLHLLLPKEVYLFQKK
jgi:hypothetical protein